MENGKRWHTIEFWIAQTTKKYVYEHNHMLRWIKSFRLFCHCYALYTRSIQFMMRLFNVGGNNRLTLLNVCTVFSVQYEQYADFNIR